MAAERNFSLSLLDREKEGSRYRLVILAARRALELSEGAPKLVEGDPKMKPATVALMEIAQGKVTYRLRKKGL